MGSEMCIRDRSAPSPTTWTIRRSGTMPCSLSGGTPICPNDLRGKAPPAPRVRSDDDRPEVDMSQVDGLLIDIDGVLSVSWVATAAHLRRHHPGAKCLLLNSGDLSEDMGGH